MLARAEAGSAYRPARQLWVRTRHGHYLPSPEMQLRAGEGWQPVGEAMNLPWIDRGCGSERPYGVRPAALFARIGSETA